MTDALNDHEGTVSIGGRNITNLRFADDIDGLAGREDELADLVECIDKTSTAFGMQINAEKTKLMTNNTNGISTYIRVNGEKLDWVKRFKYLRAIITDEGSKPEILARIAQATAALAKLKTIWNDRNIALSSKIRLMRSLVMSIFLYACESWTLTAETEKRIHAMEMRCLRKLLGITYREHITNEEVRNRTRQAIGPHEDLLTTVKQRKLRWYGHITRSTGLAKTVMQGTVQGGRRRGRQRKRWEDNIPEWTGLTLGAAEKPRDERSGGSWLPSHLWCPNGPLRLRDRQGKARQGKARQGKARQGKARQGKARQGKARQGKARQGKARQGKARQGKARQGKARQGKAYCLTK